MGLLQALFPAHAGVFPGLCAGFTYGSTLPRARGGISVPRETGTPRTLSSPRTRGYFQGIAGTGRAHALFPAHAGVFPTSPDGTATSHALPRARGGISVYFTLIPSMKDSSPRTRGYFQERTPSRSTLRLFPAHAGVFPVPRQVQARLPALPRARGGISVDLCAVVCLALSSPRTRGYFHNPGRHGSHRQLFPAHAGVFQHFRPLNKAQGSLPRARGGISTPCTSRVTISSSSPRTRGYFRQARLNTRHTQLFPAHAGVFPAL